MGNYSKRTHRETLDEEIAKALLASPTPGKDGEAVSAWERLVRATDELGAAVKACRTVLNNNPLTDITAVAVAKQVGRRGEPSLSILDDGTVMLEISYGQHEEETADEDDRRGWNSTMPPLSELRSRAAKVGVDPAPFGRKKRALLEAIEQAEEDPKPKAPRKKMVRTSAAITPVTVLNPTPEPDPEPEKPKPVPVPDPEPEPEEAPETEETPEEEVPEFIENLISGRKSRPKRTRPARSLPDVAAIATKIDMDRILMTDNEDEAPEDE